MQFKYAVVKELQHLASFKSFEVVYTRSRTTEDDLNNQIYALYHGDELQPHLLSYARILHELSDSPVYQDLFEDCPELAAIGVKKLKFEYTQKDGVYLVGPRPNDITLNDLKSKNKLIAGATLVGTEWWISARNINSHRETVTRNCKKAVAFGGKFLHNGKLPSGTTRTDYNHHVLKEMYAALHPAKAKVIAEKNAALEEEQKAAGTFTQPLPITAYFPAGWTFPGWMAFIAYGPFCRGNDETILFKASGFTNTSSRSDEKKRIADERKRAATELSGTAPVPPTNLKKGPAAKVAAMSTPVQDPAETLVLLQRDLQAFDRNQGQVGFLKSQQYHFEQKNFERLDIQAMRKCPEFDENHPAWIAVDHSTTKLQVHAKDLYDFTEATNASRREKLARIDRLMNDITNPMAACGTPVEYTISLTDPRLDSSAADSATATPSMAASDTPVEYTISLTDPRLDPHPPVTDSASAAL